MIIKAQQKQIRISSRKVRLVVDAIRDLSPSEALDQLAFIRKAAAIPVAKTIKQAIANAVKNSNQNESSLKFNTIQVGEGPTYKRWQAVSRGRAHSILKRTSHITVLLESKEEIVKAATKPKPKLKSKTKTKKVKKKKN